MLTSSTSTTQASSSTATLSSTNKNDLGQKDIFLKLLVAQMQFQDPMKPQDATAMSQQLAQFNMVESQLNTNKLLQQLVDMQTGGTSSQTPALGSSGASYLGHTVTLSQSNINYTGTPQNFNVVADATATDSLIFILDANGTPVRSMMGTLNAGNNPISWDGMTDSGAAAPSGNYTVAIDALDINGNQVGAAVQRTGIVDAVRFGANGTELVVGGVAASINDVTELRM